MLSKIANADAKRSTPINKPMCDHLTLAFMPRRIIKHNPKPAISNLASQKHNYIRNSSCLYFLADSSIVNSYLFIGMGYLLAALYNNYKLRNKDFYGHIKMH